MQLIKMLLENLVDTCEACSTHGNASAMGACLLAAYKLMVSGGGAAYTTIGAFLRVSRGVPD